MKIKELISKLQQQDPESSAMMKDDDGNIREILTIGPAHVMELYTVAEPHLQDETKFTVLG